MILHMLMQRSADVLIIKPFWAVPVSAPVRVGASQSPALQAKKDKDRQQPLLSVDAERNEWTLRPDLLSVLDRALHDSLPASRDEGKPLEGLAVRNAQVIRNFPWHACR